DNIHGLLVVLLGQLVGPGVELVHDSPKLPVSGFAHQLVEGSLLRTAHAVLTLSMRTFSASINACCVRALLSRRFATSSSIESRTISMCSMTFSSCPCRCSRFCACSY